MIKHRPISPFALPFVVALALAACDVAQVASPPQDSAVATDAADTAVATDTSVADTGTPDVVDDTPRWHVVQQDLPAAFLSVWGRDPGDVWFVGADKGDGTGPWVVHGDAAGWDRVDLREVDPVGGTMWWVYGPDATSVWLAGDFGRVFRWDRAMETVTAIPTGTDATLYGIWGADDSLMWAVGGYIAPRTGPPVIVRIEDGVGAPVAELPEALGEDVTLFKVWGTASDDVWVIGEEGTVMHWDGMDWTHETLAGEPRLVTIHGRGDDVAIVGGTSQSIILERDGDGWADVSPAGYPLLNGVSVGPDGDAFAAGMIGTAFRRESGAWTFESGIPLAKDWHGVWIDGRGDVWLAGGRLATASQLDEGAILRWGPPRDDVPAGAVRGLDPPTHAEEEAVVEAADVVEPTPEIVDTSDVEVTDDTGNTDDTVVADAEVTDDTADAVDADASPPSPLIMGELPVSNDPQSFTPMVAGQELEIVQGIQGGIHLEIALRFPADSQLAVLETPIVMNTRIDGVVVGPFSTQKYPAPRLSDGVYQTYPMPIVFATSEVAAYLGQIATIDAEVTTPGGVTLRTQATVVLVDNF